MNFNELIKEQQERNRERVNESPFISSNEKFHYVVTPERLDQLTQQTAEAVRDWMVEEGTRIWNENGGSSLLALLTQLQANKDLSEKD